MKKQRPVTDRNTVILKIREHLIKGDLGIIADNTGFTKQYVRKCLNVNFACHNLTIVDAALKLAALRQEEKEGRAKLIGELA